MSQPKVTWRNYPRHLLAQGAKIELSHFHFFDEEDRWQFSPGWFEDIERKPAHVQAIYYNTEPEHADGTLAYTVKVIDDKLIVTSIDSFCAAGICEATVPE